MSEKPEKKPVMEVVKSMTEERDKAIAATLEEFARLAKEGHISDIAIIGKVRGEPVTEFDWDSDSPLELIGALELAKVEVMTEMLSSDEDDEDDEDDS